MLLDWAHAPRLCGERPLLVDDGFGAGRPVAERAAKANEDAAEVGANMTHPPGRRPFVSERVGSIAAPADGTARRCSDPAPPDDAISWRARFAGFAAAAEMDAAAAVAAARDDEDAARGVSRDSTDLLAGAAAAGSAAAGKGSAEPPAGAIGRPPGKVKSDARLSLA